MRVLILLAAIAALCAEPVWADADVLGVEKIDSSFSDLDDDNDGFITGEEAEGESIWVYASDIDTDGDGKLSTAEYDRFVRAHPELVEADAKDEVMQSGSEQEAQLVKGLQQEFSILDKDNNSYISMDEARGSDIGKHFSRIDLDGDGKIHMMEYVEYASRHGTKLWRNPEDMR